MLILALRVCWKPEKHQAMGQEGGWGMVCESLVSELTLRQVAPDPSLPTSLA